MRYNFDENSILAGMLPSGKNVTIKIIRMDTDELLELSDDTCHESQHIPGVYLWDTNNISTKVTNYTNCLYVMTDGNKNFYGKFVIGNALSTEQTNKLLNLPTAQETADAVWNTEFTN